MNRPSSRRPEMRKRMRLRARDDFRIVYRKGRRVGLGAVVAIALDQKEGPPRVAFTAPRRVGGAVVRNRSKRRLRAAVDPLAGHLMPGMGVVLQATPATALVDFRELREQVREGLARSGALGG